MVAGEHLAQAQAGVDGMGVLGAAGNAEAAARPDAEIPGLAVKGFILR